MKKYIKPVCISIEVKESICGHYDSTGRWHLLGNQIVNEYFKEDTPTQDTYQVFNDSLSSNSDFLKFNNKVWEDQW